MCFVFVFRPFREIDTSKNSKSWNRIQKLEHGKVYVEVRTIFNEDFD